jgi:hypothetical protein
MVDSGAALGHEMFDLHDEDLLWLERRVNRLFYRRYSKHLLKVYPYAPLWAQARARYAARVNGVGMLWAVGFVGVASVIIVVGMATDEGVVALSGLVAAVVFGSIGVIRGVQGSRRNLDGRSHQPPDNS